MLSVNYAECRKKPIMLSVSVSCIINILQLYFTIIINDLHCGLYYKCVTFVKYASPRIINYDCISTLQIKRTSFMIVNHASRSVTMFIVQATGSVMFVPTAYDKTA
jgi:hypothetical protein